ncbi:hypothetical protein BGZ65_010018, partial [Modicella reniformis]
LEERVQSIEDQLSIYHTALQCIVSKIPTTDDTCGEATVACTRTRGEAIEDDDDDA